jgi:hypothetical protein
LKTIRNTLETPGNFGVETSQEPSLAPPFTLELRLSTLPSWFWRGVILVLCMLWATNFAVIKVLLANLARNPWKSACQSHHFTHDWR